MSKELAKAEPTIDARMERILWRGMGVKTIREMAEETGLSPEQIADYRFRMLDHVDALTIQQKQQKILVNLEALSNEAWEKATASTDEFRAGLYNSAIAAAKELTRQLAALQKESNHDVEVLNALRIAELVSLMHEVVDMAEEELADEYGIDRTVLYDALTKNLTIVAARRDMDTE